MSLEKRMTEPWENQGCRGWDTLQLQVDFVELEKVALSSPDPIEDLPSGSAELYEIILGSYIR